MTVCVVHQPPRVLLGMKKRGFGEGRWNGFGGKVKGTETVEETARRELHEEAGITPLDLEEVGVLDFEFQGKPGVLEVHFYKVTEFEGEPVESEEMRPAWFDQGEIPFDQMWPDDKFWLPIFLRGEYFKGRVFFENPEKILEQEIRAFPPPSEPKLS